MGHISVLLNDVLFYLNPGPNENFIDCTLGGGGHAQAILEKTSPGGKLLGIDLDKQALQETSQRLKQYKDRLILVNDNFAELEKVVEEKEFEKVRGVLLDLGLSSMQLAGKKGFSFKSEERLDMRFGAQGELDAYQIVNFWPEEEILKILSDFGEERFARAIVKQILKQRREKPIEKGIALAAIISQAIPKKFWPPKIHPATRTFQALRIAVNRELDNLQAVLPQAVNLLEKGGRLAVISYHSLEDRIVKQFIKKESKDCLCPPNFPVCRCDHRAIVWQVTKQAITSEEEEIKFNPRARSAKLRVVEKI